MGQRGEVCRILVLAPYFAPATRAGGPIRSLGALVAAAPTEFAVAVVTSNRDLASAEPLAVPADTWTTTNGSRCYYANDRNLASLFRMYRIIRQWKPDVLYCNGFFPPVFSIAPRVLKMLGWCRGTLLVVAPRGEFNIGALSIKSGKKKALLRAYKILRLWKSMTWHVSSTDEERSVRAVFPAASPILVRPNETQLPNEPLPPNGDAVAGSPTHALRMVFLGRLAPIKGLDVLLTALQHTVGNISLDIFGYEVDSDYAANCRSLADRAAPTVRITFRGHLPTSEVRPTLSGYDVMALPTAGENFGHVIAEALSVSCPVMCTDRTPWTQRLSTGGGVVVPERSASAWSRSIDEFAALDAGQRLARRRLAGDAYRKWASKPRDSHLFDLIRASAANDDPSVYRATDARTSSPVAEW